MNVRFYLSYDVKITLKSHFCCKNVIICHYVSNVVMDIITFPENLSTTSGLSILRHGVISLPGGMSYDTLNYLAIKCYYHDMPEHIELYEVQ